MKKNRNFIRIVRFILIGMGIIISIHPLYAQVQAPEEGFFHGDHDKPLLGRVVLVVDDDPTIHFCAKVQLSGIYGAKNVVCVSKGHEGIRILRDRAINIDAVVVDLYMSNTNVDGEVNGDKAMDGDEVAMRIRMLPDFCDIPIILHSSDDERSEELRHKVLDTADGPHYLFDGVCSKGNYRDMTSLIKQYSDDRLRRRAT